MRILVTGAGGLLGRALVRAADVVALDRAALDIGDARAVQAALARVRPDVVINAAAWTDVDGCEGDAARAFASNDPAALAAACGARLLHVSTDQVFDGQARRPYRPDDATGPVNVYGASKLSGERTVLAAGGTVVRTSWLFGEGGRGFVPALLRAARAGERLRVVDDRHGCPTYAGDLAAELLALAAAPPGGVLHVCGDEPTTWHGFARAILPDAEIEPIRAAAWPAAAPRPAYTVLAPSRPPRSWRAALRQFLMR